MIHFTSQVFFSQDCSKLYALGSTGETNGTFVAVLCMNSGSVLQKIKPSKDNIYRFCIDVSCTKCIVGKLSPNFQAPNVVPNRLKLHLLRGRKSKNQKAASKTAMKSVLETDSNSLCRNSKQSANA